MTRSVEELKKLVQISYKDLRPGQAISVTLEEYKLMQKHNIFNLSTRATTIVDEVPQDWLASDSYQLVGDEESEPELKTNLAEEAAALIYGDREQTHGQPDKNLQTIADFWTTYVKEKEVLTVDDVCNMMNLLKVARSKSNPDHKDNDLDSIGYILLKERIREYRRQEK